MLLPRAVAEVSALIGVTEAEFPKLCAALVESGCVQKNSWEWIYAYHAECHRSSGDELFLVLVANREYEALSMVFMHCSLHASPSQQFRLMSLVRTLGIDPSVFFGGHRQTDEKPNESVWREALGVGDGEDLDSVQSAYQRLARKYHPDLWSNENQADKQRANQKMQEVNAAWAAAKRHFNATREATEEQRRRDAREREEGERAKAAAMEKAQRRQRELEELAELEAKRKRELEEREAVEQVEREWAQVQQRKKELEIQAKVDQQKAEADRAAGNAESVRAASDAPSPRHRNAGLPSRRAVLLGGLVMIGAGIGLTVLRSGTSEPTKPIALIQPPVPPQPPPDVAPQQVGSPSVPTPPSVASDVPAAPSSSPAAKPPAERPVIPLKPVATPRRSHPDTIAVVEEKDARPGWFVLAIEPNASLREGRFDVFRRESSPDSRRKIGEVDVVSVSATRAVAREQWGNILLGDEICYQQQRAPSPPNPLGLAPVAGAAPVLGSWKSAADGRREFIFLTGGTVTCANGKSVVRRGWTMNGDALKVIVEATGKAESEWTVKTISRDELLLTNSKGATLSLLRTYGPFDPAK